MAEPYETQGTQLKRGDGASPDEAFTLIPGLNSITPVGISRDLQDITSFDDTAHNYRLKMMDGQAINCVASYYDPEDDQHNGLREDSKAGTARNFELHLADGTVVSFTALVTAWNLGAAVDGVYTMEFSLKPISDLTFTAPEE